MSSTDRKHFREYLVAGTAFAVSVCSLFLYIYQSKLMAEQQHVAVWPYVEWYTSNLTDYHLSAHNKGVGPAIVRKVEMRWGDVPVADNRELVEAVMGKDTTLGWQNSALQGRVLSPGEEVAFLRIPDLAEAREFQEKFGQRKLSLSITYCSIYGDCWISTGLRASRTADAQLDLY